MKNFTALIMLLGITFGLILVGTDIFTFIEPVGATYLLFFMYGVTTITFGTDGSLKSIVGLKYLFTDEMVGGGQAQRLAQIFHRQITFCYGGAFIGLIVGSIAIHTNVDTAGDFSLHRSYAVNITILFYAAIVSEVVLRPLSIKLKTGDVKLQAN